MDVCLLWVLCADRYFRFSQ